MNDILPLWASALALLLLVLGTLVVVLLRDSRPSASHEGAGEGGGDPQADDARLRALFLARRQELQDSLDGDALQQAQRELDQQLLESLQDRAASPARTPRLRAAWSRMGAAAALSLGSPLAALGVYLQVGDPRAAIAATQPVAAPHPVEGADVGGMVERLTQRLQQQPGDLEGWMVLARSLEVMERFGEASQAYRRAIALAAAPGQTWLRAKLQADLADTIASEQGGALVGPAQEAIEASLALDPDQPKALALAGTAAAGRGDIVQARQHWGRLLALLEPGSEMAGRVSADLAALGTGETEGTGPGAGARSTAVATVATRPPSVRATSSSAAQPAQPGAVLSGVVSLSPQLASHVQAQDTLFLIIRDAEQPGPPLGAVRLTAGQLPYRFSVDDTAAMMQTRLPSSFKRLSITARISRTHQPAARPGDPTSEAVKADQGQRDIQLVIDRLVP